MSTAVPMCTPALAASSRRVEGEPGLPGLTGGCGPGLTGGGGMSFPGGSGPGLTGWCATPAAAGAAAPKEIRRAVAVAVVATARVTFMGDLSAFFRWGIAGMKCSGQVRSPLRGPVSGVEFPEHFRNLNGTLGVDAMASQAQG